MARLTFDTPAGDYCDWDDKKCLAFNRHEFGYCHYFKEYLKGDGTAIRKCDQCKALGKYGTANRQHKE